MASLTDDPGAFYLAEAKRQKERYGEDAEVPMRGTPVTEGVTVRIARLGKAVAEAGQQLDGARTTYDKAARNKDECQARFISLSDELMRAIHEHREGTPDGVPYPR